MAGEKGKPKTPGQRKPPCLLVMHTVWSSNSMTTFSFRTKMRQTAIWRRGMWVLGVGRPKQRLPTPILVCARCDVLHSGAQTAMAQSVYTRKVECLMLPQKNVYRVKRHIKKEVCDVQGATIDHSRSCTAGHHERFRVGNGARMRCRDNCYD